MAAPAFAAPPEQWADADPVSAFEALLVIALIPAGLFLLITVLVYVPSMARGEKYTPGLAWRNENEWFGGPRGGVEATDTAQPDAIEGSGDTGRGGASARW
jgi:hypothetical protein